jgi:hypothetical protein
MLFNSDRNPFSNQPGKEGTWWAARETLSAPTRKRAKTLALRGTFPQPIGKRTNVISSKEPFQLPSAGEGVQDIKNMRNLPGEPKMSTTIGTIPATNEEGSNGISNDRIRYNSF